MDEQRTVTVTEIWNDDRWTERRDAAEQEGFESAVAVPAGAGPGARIAPNLYSKDDHPWDGERLGRADLIAQQVGRVMALCIRIAGQTVINDDLTAAMASRPTIDQATGVVMARNRCTAASAAWLRPRAEN